MHQHALKHADNLTGAFGSPVILRGGDNLVEEQTPPAMNV